jgi:hypothetical protein
MGIFSFLFGVTYESSDPSLAGNPNWIDDGWYATGERCFRRRGVCKPKDLSGTCSGCIYIGRADKCTMMPAPKLHA